MVTLDFSKKRVRLNNKALSKFGIAHYFEKFQPALCWTVYYGTYSYGDLAHRFRDYVINNRDICEKCLGDCLSIEI